MDRSNRPLKRWLKCRAACAAFGLACAWTAWAQSADVPDFNRDIRPILANNCFQCHGPDAAHRKARLRLDMESGAKSRRDGYAILEPGDPGASELVRRITSTDPDELMPPPDSGKSLSKEDIARLQDWIRVGAPWSDHWAYVPPTRHPLPAVADADWPAHWIDRFVLAQLERAGVPPSPEADRTTLVRRLSFDLLGLPPSEDLVREYLDDDAPGAWSRLIDQLLDSPRFGERMAMYWLDLVRYADTVGYHGDQDHHISPYRDWVIDAFNDNVPFDRFTRDQLAGDLAPGAGIDEKIASGYNRLLQTSHEGGVQPKEYLAIYAADRVRNLSAVWMGATVGCAQCHDHKYDPYTARDFYSLAAFFADVDEARHFTEGKDTSPTRRPPELAVLTKSERARMAVLRGERSMLEEALSQSLKGSQVELQERLRSVEAELDAIAKRTRLTMVTEPIAPRPMRILPRGNWLDESGPLVDPAVPAFLGRLDLEGRATRLDLARWLTDRDQGAGGLTARVMVNRLWSLLFGNGLASSLEDFGAQGEPPTHPQLLDRLSLEFMDSGWDLKHILRAMVSSKTYRQTSDGSEADRRRDPYNRLLARQGRYRLPAEMIRDQALAVSGLLVEDVGGSSARPKQPEGYYRHLNFPKRNYRADTDRSQWRRGVYMHWQRQYLHPMLKALDAPSREECTAQRTRSNTPLAALVLLNDPCFVEAARALAQRLLLETGPRIEDRDRIGTLFRWATIREPATAEADLLAAWLRTNELHYAEHPEDAAALAGVGDAPHSPALDPVRLAAWTMVARAVLNLSETITRH